MPGPPGGGEAQAAHQVLEYRAEMALLLDSTIPGRLEAQFSLNNVHKRGLKHHHFISRKAGHAAACDLSGNDCPPSAAYHCLLGWAL